MVHEDLEENVRYIILFMGSKESGANHEDDQTWEYQEDKDEANYVGFWFWTECTFKLSSSRIARDAFGAKDSTVTFCTTSFWIIIRRNHSKASIIINARNEYRSHVTFSPVTWLRTYICATITNSFRRWTRWTITRGSHFDKSKTRSSRALLALSNRWELLSHFAFP